MIFLAFQRSGVMVAILPCLYEVTSCLACSRPACEVNSVLRFRSDSYASGSHARHGQALRRISCNSSNRKDKTNRRRDPEPEEYNEINKEQEHNC